jgi:hypothetical protein
MCGCTPEPERGALLHVNQEETKSNALRFVIGIYQCIHSPLLPSRAGTECLPGKHSNTFFDFLEIGRERAGEVSQCAGRSVGQTHSIADLELQSLSFELSSPGFTTSRCR